MGLPVTTDQVSLPPQSRTLLLLWQWHPWQLWHQYCLLFQSLKLHEWWIKTKGKKGRMMKGGGDVRVFGPPQAQAIKGGSSAARACVRALKQLMRIFNICWVQSVLKVIHHSTDSVLASWACWLSKMHAFRPEDEFRKVYLVQGNSQKRAELQFFYHWKSVPIWTW